MSLKLIRSRISRLLHDFAHVIIGSIFEINRAAALPLRATWKPKGYGRPVTEILFSRKR